MSLRSGRNYSSPSDRLAERRHSIVSHTLSSKVVDMTSMRLIFKAADVHHRLESVLRAARRAPVYVVQVGRPDLVLLPWRWFARLVGMNEHGDWRRCRGMPVVGASTDAGCRRFVGRHRKFAVVGRDRRARRRA